MKKIPVVAVVGPTASGKSDLAVEICLRLNGEVVSADSMQIYKGMDVASAKPTLEEKRGVPHHLMDFLENTQSFSVAEYQRLAAECINDIHARGKLPVVAGGTGLYIDTLLKNIVLAKDSYDEKVRADLMRRVDTEGVNGVFDELKKIDPEYAARLHENDVKRIVRALELWYASGITMTRQIEESRAESPYRVCFIGLDAEDRQYLYDRINRRVDLMLENGLEQEAREYLKLKNTATSSQAIGCKEFKPYFDGEISFGEAVENLKRATRRYCKRQLTWFRRNDCINWLQIDKYQSKRQLYDEAVGIAEKFRRENE